MYSTRNGNKASDGGQTSKSEGLITVTDLHPQVSRSALLLLILLDVWSFIDVVDGGVLEAL